jgi:SAM-dependent methyltransferase
VGGVMRVVNVKLERMRTTLGRAALAAFFRTNYWNEGAGNEFDSEECCRFLAGFDWDEEAKSYHGYHFPSYLKILAYLKSFPRQSRVLELGAAPYGMTLMMKHLGLFDHVSLAGFKPCDGDKIAQRTLRFTPRGGGSVYHFEEHLFDAERQRWPYPDGSFDLVVSCWMFEHFLYDPMHAVTEANRVLKNGGRLLIAVPNVLRVETLIRYLSGQQPNPCLSYFPEHAADRHNRELTPSDLRTLFESGGFSIELFENRNITRPEYVSPVVLTFVRLYGGTLGERQGALVGIGKKTGPVTERYPQSLYIPFLTARQKSNHAHS